MTFNLTQLLFLAGQTALTLIVECHRTYRYSVPVCGGSRCSCRCL